MGCNEENGSDFLLVLIIVGVISILCFLGAFYCYDWIFGKLFAAVFIAGGLFSVILCIGGVAALIGNYNDDKARKEDLEQLDLFLQSLPEAQKYYYGHNTIGFSVKKGYSECEIKGLKYRDVGLRDIGKFEGYAKTEPENPKDSFAIAIYREDGRHLGYIPREQFSFFHLIQCEGGYIHAYGYIQAPQSDVLTGCVCVETIERQRLGLPRNQPYKTNDKFYDYEEGYLTEFLTSKQNALFIGRLVYDRDGKVWRVEANDGAIIRCKNVITDDEDECDDIIIQSFNQGDLFNSISDIPNFDREAWLAKQLPTKRAKTKKTRN